jgi:NADP-dependent 3-hydroxy acid dehydrogenase YdfG
MAKSLLIIGAGPGIGAATAERFGREGWRVVLAARNAERLDALADPMKRNGLDIETRHVDAADPASVRAVIAQTDKDLSGLDTVHYNAAVLRQSSLFDLDDADVTTDLAVNISGALAAVRATHEVVDGRGGTVLLTGGGLALNPNPDYVTLGLGKVAIRWLAEGLFERLAAADIHIASVTVNRIIAPGSPDASGVADSFWALQTQSRDRWSWEHPYPG